MKANLFILLISFVIAIDVSAQGLPRVISNPDPAYPPAAAELGFGGTVKLFIRIDKKGKVKVLQAWGPNAPCSSLDDDRVRKIRESVIAAATKAEFEPPMKDEKPTELEATISYSFDSFGKPFHGETAEKPTGRMVEAGVLTGKVKYLAKPDYPASARAIRLAGMIPVSVVVGYDGKVIAASALGGHKLLQDPAVEAACRSSIEPVQLSGQPVQVSGVITFTFVP